MERSEWPDDDAADGDAYPPAPLPAHERTWRHPSELGRAVWVHSEEPPLAIGRGLLLTTGAIGGLLSLAVLWAMLPSAGRGGIASPTVVVSTANDAPAAVITARPDTLVATSLDQRLPPTTLATPTAPVSAVPPQQSPSTTSAVPQTPEVTTQSAELLQAPVAVGIGDSMVITTARAVRGRKFLTLTDADGNPHNATVLMVDRDRGLAVLSADVASMTTSYGVGPAASPGDVVTVVGSTPTSANVGVDADGNLTLDAWADSTPEGAPILNADGQLVGICSHGASGFELVSVESVGEMMPPAKPTPWLGVRVTAGDENDLTVTWLDPDGPAAAVGLVLGDVISAVDGAPVGTPDEMKAAIATFAPGDVVNVTVTHADLTIVEVQITLVAAPSM